MKFAMVASVVKGFVVPHPNTFQGTYTQRIRSIQHPYVDGRRAAALSMYDTQQALLTRYARWHPDERGRLN